MPDLLPFEFSDEIIDRFRAAREIPVHFYNKDGQILIYPKENASNAEIERLLRFVDQGVYFDSADAHVLTAEPPPPPAAPSRDIPEGLSDTQLISDQVAAEMTDHTTTLFAELKASSFTSVQAKGATRRLSATFDAFENQADAMVGLVNIVERMRGQDASYDVELAIKRTVVAMAMKTRGMKAQSNYERKQLQQMCVVTMMSALLCDIGAAKMKLPEQLGLSKDEMSYVQNHPLMSYLMLAHEGSVEAQIKHNVLCHHRPLRDGTRGNNYPATEWLGEKLTGLEHKYRTESNRLDLADDIQQQLGSLRNDQVYEEDIAILSLASEFASLTSDVPWRKAFPARRAVQMMVNNSFFTHPNRAIREFLDYVAVSLCDNKKIINVGDFIVVAAGSRDERTTFEVCRITSSTRYQSRPGVDRIATVQPIIEQEPKLRLAGFSLTSLKPDPRHAHYELTNDDSRHIVYAIDKEHDAKLFHAVASLTR